MAVRIRITECPVYFRAGESKAVLAEQHALLAVGLAAVFVASRNSSLLQPIFQIAPRFALRQTGPDRIVYLILGFVRFPQSVAVYLLLAFGIVKAVFGGQFLADFSDAESAIF